MEEEVVMEEGTKKSFPIKKTIITVAVVAVVLALIIGILNIILPSPQKTVKKFIKQFNKGKISKAFDCVDIIGMAVFDEDELEDFKEDYEDFKDEYEDEIEDQKEDMEEEFEELEEEIKDYDEFKLEIKSIKKAKKVKKVKNMYKVPTKLKLTVKEEDEKTNRKNLDIDFYVYKVDGKYKIVGFGGDDGYVLKNF